MRDPMGMTLSFREKSVLLEEGRFSLAETTLVDRFPGHISRDWGCITDNDCQESDILAAWLGLRREFRASIHFQREMKTFAAVYFVFE
jgi:hypothetical protein